MVPWRVPESFPVRALCLLVPLFLCGCSKPLALAFFEPPFWDAVGGRGGLGRDLERSAGERGYRVRLLVAEAKGGPLDQLERILAKERIGTVILGPLASFEGARIAGSFPGTRFILVDGQGGEDAAGNTVQLQFDRRAAFRTAGAAAARSAADGAAGPTGRVGVVRMLPAGAGDFDGDAFREGAEGVTGAGSVPIRELPETADRPQVRKAVEEMRTAGVEVFLLRAGSMASFLLETLRETGGSAVVEDWASSRMLPAQVFLSVEEDLPAGIGLCLDGRAGGGALVYGPVRIVAGEARIIPAGLRETLDHAGE